MSSGMKSDKDQQHEVRADAKRPTSGFFKRTHEEALATEHTVPLHEMFDLETGLVKEAYRMKRSPSPPAGTVVFEIGTGRAFNYEPGTGLERLHPDSLAMDAVRRSAANSGIRPVVTGCRAGTPTGRIRRVLALPQDSRNEKVMRWETIAQEQRPVSVSVRPSEEPTEEEAGGQCSCVALVTSDHVRIDMRKPDLADSADDSDRRIRGSSTLRYLWIGYRNYMVSKIQEDVHKLCAYSCRSPRTKSYNAYKSISCRPKPATQDSSTPPPSAAGYNDFYSSMAVINQYLHVFSALGDFNYTWITPSLKGGVANVMVVDKLYTYNEARRMYMPYYQLLDGDNFTDFTVNEISKLDCRGIRIRHMRFLSTPNTILYTNRLTLSRLVGVKRSWTTSKAVDDPQPSTSSDSRKHTPLPIKKRCFEAVGRSGEQLAAKDSEDRTRLATYVLREDDCMSDLKHLPGCSRFENLHEGRLQTERTESVAPTDVGCTNRTVGPGLLETAERNTGESRARNPTLVVFKLSLDDSEPDTLLCNIIAEMHLSHEIRY